MKTRVARFGMSSLIVLVSTSFASATLFPIGELPIYGEVRLCSVASATSAQCAESVFVDWRVTPAARGYVYEYQIENTSSHSLNAFGVDVDWPIGGFDRAIGWESNAFGGWDWDVVHDFPWEQAEPVNCCVVPTSVFKFGPSWHFEIPANWESTVLRGWSSGAPDAGYVSVQGATMTFNNRSTLYVPAPIRVIPEPGTLGTLAAALLLLALRRHARRLRS